jgi:hypothetical protein
MGNVVDVSVWCVSDDRIVSRCDVEAIGGAAVGLTRSGDAADFIPLVDAGATKGSNGHVLVVDTSKRGHVHVGSLLCGGIYKPNPNAGLVLMGRKFSGVSGEFVGDAELGPKLIMCDSLPEPCPRLFGAITQQLTKVGVVTRSCRRRRQMQVVAVRVVWCLEVELAKTQIDAVNTDVINKESARPWSIEGAVLCVSYPVLGIYFGRRR